MRKLFSIMFWVVLLLIFSTQGTWAQNQGLPGDRGRSPLGQSHTQTGRCYMTTSSTTASMYELARANSM